jgi:uncharacterized membrane protein YoaK (UPF0700 family)
MADDVQPVKPFGGELPLVMALASVAGFLDAISLARITHTFVAFQTGNLVLVGLGVGRAAWSTAGPPAVAVLAYVVGSALVPLELRDATRVRKVAVRRLLGTAVALLMVESVAVALVCGLGGSRPGPVLRYACIVLSAVAMAFQTPVVRGVEGISVSTTFTSGMLTRLGQALGARTNPARRAHENEVTRVLGGTVLAFLAGATLAGVLLDPLGNATLVVPVIALALIAGVTLGLGTD